MVALLGVVACKPLPPIAAHRFLAASDTAVYESLDGGDSWAATAGQPLLDGAPPAYVADVAMTANADVVAGGAGAEVVVWRSIDRGATWGVALRVPADGVHLSCVALQCFAVTAADAFDADSGGYQTSYGAYRSADGGFSWTATTAAPPPDVTRWGDPLVRAQVLADGTLQVVVTTLSSSSYWSTYTSRPKLSVDGGQTWIQPPALPADPPPCFPATCYAQGRTVTDLAELDGDAVAVGRLVGLSAPTVTSIDGGQTWAVSSVPPSVGALTAVAEDGGDLLAVGPGPRVFASPDGGDSWAEASGVPAVDATSAVQVGFRDVDVVLVGSAAGYPVVVSHDRGATWSIAPTQPPGAPPLVAITD